MATRQVHILSWMLLAGLLACMPARIRAQHQPVLQAEAALRFERIGNRQGLSHNTVRTILQDRQGYLWFGTADGLNRYDGYDFVVYRHHPDDSTSLSNNTIRVLLEDRAGHLWVGTEAGLNEFDPVTGRFTQHALSRYGHPLDISALLEDAQGVLWIGTPEGVFRYDPASRRFAWIEEVVARHTYSLALDASGTIWIGALISDGPGRLYRYMPEAGTAASLALPSPWDTYTALHMDRSDRLWIGTTEGVGLFDPAAHRFQPRLPGISSNVLYRDRKDGVWMGTESGLYRYDPATRTYALHPLDPSGTSTLTNDVLAIYEDRAGTLWVGTRSGLYRYDPHLKPFTHLRHLPSAPNSLSSNAVMAVYEDAEGVLWVGTLGGGLNRVDRARGTVTHYRHRPGDPHSLADDNVWAVHQDRQGRLWIGTDGGLCRLDTRTGRFTRHSLNRDDPAYVNVIAEDAAGFLWLGGYVVYRLDPRTGAVSRFAHVDDLTETPVVNIQALYAASPDTVWLGTEFQGLYLLRPTASQEADAWVRVVDEAFLPGKAVRFIYPYDDLLWLGTNMGLVRFHPGAATVDRFLPQDGLPGSEVYAILEDGRRGLWVSTNRDLARLDPRAGRFQRFTSAEGTGTTEFNRRAAFKNTRGTFFFGGLNGVTTFDPEALRDNPYVPPVVITRVEKANRDGTVMLNAARTVQEGLVLDPGDYSFSFEFAALNYLLPEKNQYAYMLEGIDERWVEAGTRRYAGYTGLPAGSYVFRVKGSNNDGVWNEEGVSVAVTIRPPFWQRGWFRGLAALALVGLLVAAYRYRVAQLLKVERMRLRIAGDLHDDIGASLGSIAILSDVVQRQTPLPEPAHRHLARISQAARQTSANLQDIVWLINPEHDQWDEVIARMQRIAATLLDGTAYTFEVPATALAASLDMEFRRHFLLLFKEALHNVARHAQATKVDIRLAVEEKTLSLSIQDDGVGFDPDQVAEGHGLKSLQSRAAQMGGPLAIESHPGSGTTLTFSTKTT